MSLGFPSVVNHSVERDLLKCPFKAGSESLEYSAVVTVTSHFWMRRMIDAQWVLACEKKCKKVRH